MLRVHLKDETYSNKEEWSGCAKEYLIHNNVVKDNPKSRSKARSRSSHVTAETCRTAGNEEQMTKATQGRMHTSAIRQTNKSQGHVFMSSVYHLSVYL